MYTKAEDFFKESRQGFIVYVVEQRFAHGRGNEYFKSYKGTPSYLSSEKDVKRTMSVVYRWMQKNTPQIAELLKATLKTAVSPLSIAEVIPSLAKLFAVHQYTAAGIESLDPIIIVEGNVAQKSLTELVTMHENSPLMPVIIIVLKDDDFERAKDLLRHCPDGMNVKMIRNSGETEFYRIINTGADDIEGFLDSFTKQGFSTCSKTKRSILVSDEWAGNSVIKQYSPLLFQVRSSLLLDEKDAVKSTIDEMITSIETRLIGAEETDSKLLQSLACMSKLNRVYCCDLGGRDIHDAWEIAASLDNEVLLAHIYRYSFFLSDISMDRRMEMLLHAENVFHQNKIEDHAIYCRNNYLNQGMYHDKIALREYRDLLERAIHNVPGLVGMSYIYNNTGVAYTYSTRYIEAIDFFEKGLDYAHDRDVPWLALRSNLLIAKEMAGLHVSEHEILSLLNSSFDLMGFEKLPFITANFVSNCVMLAYKRGVTFAEHLINTHRVINLLNASLQSNIMGSGSLCEQLSVIYKDNPTFPINEIVLPTKKSHLAGVRKNFIRKYGLNPLIFHTWM